ncbi:hypothetical protein D3C72_1791840 [compost metagenome]
MREHRLRALGVMLGRVDAGPAGRAHHHRTAQPAARAVAHVAGVVEDVVDGRVDEARELDLGHRLEPHRRHADGRADDAAFGQRGVDHARLAKAGLQAHRGTEHAAVDADVLA